MNKGKCSICGQRLTDASGSWRLSLYDFGINKELPMRMMICSWCKNEIDEWLQKFSEEQGKKINKY